MPALSGVDGRPDRGARVVQPALPAIGGADRPRRQGDAGGDALPLPEVRMSPLPWDELAGAHADMEEAERHGTPAEMAAARTRWLWARDRLGLVAATIFNAAVSGFGSNANGFFGGGEFMGTPQEGYVLPATLARLAD